MGIGYIKLPIAFEAMIENADDGTVGRLIRAMLWSCRTGEEPDFKKGTPELLLWPQCREAVIDTLRSYEKMCKRNQENGKKGGRPPHEPQESDDPFV